MLKRFRIEVEEATIAETVIALSNYEHALIAAEAQRFCAGWPVEFSSEEGIINEPNTSSHWGMDTGEREFFVDELGVEITEELIEYDASLPGYKGRRVVRLTRVDTRNPHFIPLAVMERETLGEHLARVSPEPGFKIEMSGTGIDSGAGNSGTNP